MTSVADFAILLQQKIGLSADTIGLGAIESSVKARASACGLKSLYDYWEHVHACDAELQELIDEVVVPETWFFRDSEAFAALAREACEKWLPAHPGQELRLLSLPCATGEEPYSMAMALLMAGFPAGLFRVDAIDISARLLKFAEKAVYGRNSFRGNGPEFRDQFFEQSGNGARLAQAVRAQVRFRHGNLLDPGFVSDTTAYDFAFCRNVLIYFDRATQDRAVQTLTRLLKPDGMLFVGSSESGLFLDHDFAPVKAPRAFAFRKKAQSAHAAIADPAGLSKPGRRSVPGADRRLAAKSVLKPVATSRPAATARPPGQPVASAMEEIVRLANEGRLNEAIQRCDEHLRSGGPSVQAYHLLGLAHDAAGRPEEAEQYYRKVLYLDPCHQEALVHLAFLIEKQGDSAGAQRLHMRAKRAGGGA
ncbi:MAG: methyltransferase domain-containing protein [Burkholderiales bacterium]|nr:methyltransferase domain-containing protein [Burkholderiales bacterium]